MSDDLPEGWMPTPFGVEEAEAPQLAAELTRIAAETLPGFEPSEEATAALAATITRLPVTSQVIGRVWHALGTSATGAIADLSVVEGVAEVPDSPFAHTIPQKTVPFEAGKAVLSLVAPAEHVRVGMLLRAQRREGDRVLVADVVGANASVLGLVLDDVIALVGGTTSHAGHALATDVRVS